MKSVVMNHWIFMPPTSKKLEGHIASGTFVRACIFMPPTSKKLEGHIASGTFVRACVRPSVRVSVRYTF